MLTTVAPQLERSGPVRVLAAMRALLAEVDLGADDIYERWRPSLARRAFKLAAKNFAQYLALRRIDIRPLQISLMPLGLSSLGRCEGRVRPNIAAVIDALAYQCGEPVERAATTSRAFFRGQRLLQAETERIFGPEGQHRAVRIMVTLPTEAADDEGLIVALVAAGMDAARINCAHDSVDVWRKMAAHVRTAERLLGRRCIVHADLAGPKIRTLEVRARKGGRVRVGDRIALVRNMRDAKHRGTAMTCTIPEIFNHLHANDPVWIDDGSIGCVVERISSTRAWLRVTQATDRGHKLHPDKGLNFPNTYVPAIALDDPDRKALAAIVDAIDVVGLSFVREVADVRSLQSELERLGYVDLPIVLKVETRDAVDNLPELLVAAAGRGPTAVMIARGDLAVEIGYRRLAEMQEEILWLCEAASVPVIWATQVLDGLVKCGIPTRAEITDAALSERAECVMLNKGPHVVEAVRTLAELLPRMEAHQTKKTSRMRALHAWLATP